MGAGKASDPYIIADWYIAGSNTDGTVDSPYGISGSAGAKDYPIVPRVGGIDMGFRFQVRLAGSHF